MKRLRKRILRKTEEKKDERKGSCNSVGRKEEKNLGKGCKGGREKRKRSRKRMLK